MAKMVVEKIKDAPDDIDDDDDFDFDDDEDEDDDYQEGDYKKL